jgi:hypothetical protein
MGNSCLRGAVVATAMWAVIAAGAVTSDAAPVHAPAARFAAKGAPPAHGEATRARAVTPSAGEVDFLYVDTFQFSTGLTGAGATIVQADPALGAADFHSLGEIAVESIDGLQIVEIGWNVDEGVNGDLQPHLFVFHWIDGVPTCYNACGWVQVSPTKMPGMRLATNEAHKFEIKQIHGDWWLSYDDEAMGFFPQTEWGGRFLHNDLTQWFGEIAAGSVSPCTQMGTGEFGVTAQAAAFGKVHVFDGNGQIAAASLSPGVATAPDLYDIGQFSPTGFGFGGPGSVEGCCVPTSCEGAGAACGSVTSPTCGDQMACGACAGEAICTLDHKCIDPAGGKPRAAVDRDASRNAAVEASAAGCNTGGAGGAGAMLGGLFVLGVCAIRRRPRA